MMVKGTARQREIVSMILAVMGDSYGGVSHFDDYYANDEAVGVEIALELLQERIVVNIRSVDKEREYRATEQSTSVDSDVIAIVREACPARMKMTEKAQSNDAAQSFARGRN
jgi:hypothetical protein